MRLALLVLAACQQDAPARAPAPARDAAAVPVDTPGPARTASPPRFYLGGGTTNAVAQTFTFDSKVEAIERKDDPEGRLWYVTVAGPMTIVDEGKTRKRHVASDVASRSFSIALPAGLEIDLRVGQHLRGTVTSIPGIFAASTHTRIEDDRGVVFALDPGGHASRVGKVVQGLGGMDFEVIHALEVQLDDKTWTSFAGWSTRSGYATPESSSPMRSSTTTSRGRRSAWSGSNLDPSQGATARTVSDVTHARSAGSLLVRRSRQVAKLSSSRCCHCASSAVFATVTARACDVGSHVSSNPSRSYGANSSSNAGWRSKSAR
jgi:hypothetical protein